MESESITRERLRLKKAYKGYALAKWHQDKIDLANDWIENEETQMERPIIQGAIFVCELGQNIGTEQNGERPVLIISNDRINSTSGNVKAIPLSKRLKTKTITNKGKKVIVPRMTSHYFLKKKKYTFLARDSAVKAEELTTVNKVRLKRHLGNVDPEDLKKILNRVKWVFGI